MQPSSTCHTTKWHASTQRDDMNTCIRMHNPLQRKGEMDSKHRPSCPLNTQELPMLCML